MKRMKQLSLAETGFLPKAGKQTRKAVFLAEMETVVPWARLEALIEPFYPKKGNGRPPMPLGTMLRIHFMQQWFGYSDPAMEEALHDVPLLRRFAGLDAFEDVMPDESTILRFRHLLEKHDLAVAIFAEVGAVLSEKGLSMKRGTVVDATLIAAPSSTKNEDKKRDPEMTQTKKGNQWHFGMKAHIGVDAETGVVHTLVTTSANVSDVTQAHALLHGEERFGVGDAGYQGAEKREENQGRQIQWEIAMRPGKRKALPDTPIGRLQERIEQAKARIRAKVEHPFRIIKNLFGMKKVSYRGLAKNTARLYTLFGLANLLIGKSWSARNAKNAC